MTCPRCGHSPILKYPQGNLWIHRCERGCGHYWETDRVISTDWTSTPPSVPGWYWHKYELGEPRIYEIDYAHDKIFGLQIYQGDEITHSLDAFISEFNGQWAGPIQPPE